MPKNVYFLSCKAIKPLLRFISKVELYFPELYECALKCLQWILFFLLGFAMPCVSNEVTLLGAIPFMIVMKDE